MKGQGQQPPNPNGTARGAGNSFGSMGSGAGGATGGGSLGTGGGSSNASAGTGVGTAAPAPVPLGANAVPGGTQSFAQQGFAGVSTQPAPAAPGGVAPGGTTPIHAPSNTAPSTLPGTMWTGSAPAAGSADLSAAMRTAQDAAYRGATGYLDPQFANSQHDLEAKLANQGIPQNSEAWNRAMDDFNRGKTFAYGQAQQSAVQQGNAAQAQLFNQGLEGAKFSNTVRQQLVNEGFTKEQIDNLEQQHRFDNSMTQRNQDINELMLQQRNPLDMLNALLSGGSVTQPNFTNTPNAGVGSTDILAAIQQAYGGNLNAYNAQMGNANSSNSGLAAIIAALICDRRLKKNIRQIGMHVVGVPLYEFDYVWGEHGVGVMADELEEVRPEAVITLVCGMKAVDYARI